MDSSILNFLLSDTGKDNRQQNKKMSFLFTKLQCFDADFNEKDQKLLAYLSSSIVDKLDDYCSFFENDDYCESTVIDSEILEFLKEIDDLYSHLVSQAVLNQSLLIENYDGNNSLFCHLDNNIPDIIALSKSDMRMSKVYLLHEIGHFLDYKMTNYKFIDNNLLSEVHSIFLELLFINHMVDKKDDFKYLLSYFDRKRSILNDVSVLMYMTTLNRLFKIEKLNMTSLHETYRKYINKVEDNHEIIISDTLNFDYKTSLKYFISYLVATILVKEYTRSPKTVIKTIRLILKYNSQIHSLGDLKKIGIDLSDEKTIDYIIQIHDQNDKIRKQN